MNRALLVSAIAFAAAGAATARAQETHEPDFFKKTMDAPLGAFELNLSPAYNQAWGDLTDSVSVAGQTFGRQVQDVAGAGLALEVDLGYRASPEFAAGFYGTIAQFTNQTDVPGTLIRSLTLGVQGTWYAQPFRAFCPWLVVGTGYRGNFIIPDVGGNTSRHGWEIARLQLGADFRLSREVAIAPFIGGDVNVLFTEDLPNGQSRSLNGAPAFLSFTLGIVGRFDIGGTYVTQSGNIASRD